MCAQIVADCAARAKGADKQALREGSEKLEGALSEEDKYALAHDETLAHRLQQYRVPALATQADRELEVIVDPERAGFSAWYEMFPRSAGDGTAHGTFRDCVNRLPYI